jgi:CRP-like cAMP-binding protein
LFVLAVRFLQISSIVDFVSVARGLTSIRELSMFESLLETIAGGMNLPAEQVDLIKSLWKPRQLRRGQFFQRVGEVTTHGGFVVRGCFRTYTIDARGRETILHFSPERAFIGDITSAVTGRPTPYEVDAIEPSTILRIDLASFNRMLEAFPDMAREYRFGLQRSHPALAARVPQRMLASYLGITPETLSRIRRSTSRS